MSIRLIDRTPPEPTGNTQQDLSELSDYCAYLREQINFILTTLNRRGNDGNQ